MVNTKSFVNVFRFYEDRLCFNLSVSSECGSLIFSVILVRKIISGRRILCPSACEGEPGDW